MGADKANLRVGLLVVECFTSSSDPSKDGSFQNGKQLSAFIKCGLWADISVNFNEGVRIDHCYCTWKDDHEMKLDAVSVKRLFGVQQKLPPTVTD